MAASTLEYIQESVFGLERALDPSEIRGAETNQYQPCVYSLNLGD
jgi:hypothetical protein